MWTRGYFETILYSMKYASFHSLLSVYSCVYGL